jgi:conjugal transfer/type IV secretion protein DotA/TraY
MAAAEEAKDKDMAAVSFLMSKTIAQSILSVAVWSGEGWTDGMNGSASVRDASSLANPFRTVTSIGETLNGIAMTMWVAAGAIEVKGGIASALPGTGEGIRAFAHWVAITLSSMVVALIPMGFILSFLLPFLPIITWIRLLVAYLLTAVEAVVAAPLAVIMMVTPEGEGISGTRLERAIQLLAAVILKPTLMVIGLIAALTLSYVSFGIVNLLFWKVAASMTNLGGIFEIMAILVIYTSLTFQVSKGSVVIMQKLHEQILDWMASGVGGRSFGDDAEQGVQSSMSETKGSLNSVSGSLSRTVSDRSRMRQMRIMNDENRDSLNNN